MKSVTLAPAMASCVVGLLCGQELEVGDWQTAMPGVTGDTGPLKEPHVGVTESEDVFVAAYLSPPDDLLPERWCYARGTTGAWLETVTWGATTSDPVVVADNETRKFLFVNLTRPAIQLRRFDIFNGSFDVWPDGSTVKAIMSLTNTEGIEQMDKPWIVAGARKPGSQEFYVSALDGSVTGEGYGVQYAWSTDGGDTWISGLAQDSQGGTIYSFFAPQISVVGSTQMELPLYMIVRVGGGIAPGAYEFCQGDDTPQGVVFSRLMTKINGQAQALRLSTTHSEYGGFLPGSFDAQGPPVILADPVSASRFYVVHMDLCNPNHNPGGEACGTSTDVDVKCTVFERVAGTSLWARTNTRRINGRKTASNDEDQFLGGATIDKMGRIHVVYYDDREYDQSDSSNPFTHRWDIYYAYSNDSGQSFSEYRLKSPNEPADPEPGERIPVFDAQIPQVFGKDELGEYQGIVAVDDPYSPGGVLVWMAFVGTDPEPPLNSSAKDVFVARVVHPPIE